MNWNPFKKVAPPEPVQSERRPAQIRDVLMSPYETYFASYIPLTANLELYDVIREALPVMDVMITKRADLIGKFELDALGNKPLQDFFDALMSSAKIDYFGTGLQFLLNQVYDSVYGKGFSVFELVPNKSYTEVDRFKIGRANDFRFQRDANTGDIIIGQIDVNGFRVVPIKDSRFVYYMAMDVRDGHPQGRSLLYCLPFIAQILIRMYKSIDNVVWRFGDPSMVAILTGGENTKQSDLETAASSYQAQITDVMIDRKQGKTRDIGVGVPYGGAFDLKTLGSDARPMNTTELMRVTIEQAICKSGVPPSFFGLSWSSTERMASEQSEHLISIIENDREKAEPVIRRMIETAMILNGFSGRPWAMNWNTVNLKDEEKQAKARFANAQALEKEIASRIQLFELGMLPADELIEFAVEHGLITEKQLKVVGREKMLIDIQTRYERKASRELIKSMLEE